MAYVLDQSYTSLNLQTTGGDALRTTFYNSSGIHTFTKLAQSFTPSSTQYTNRVELRLQNINGTPSGSIWVTIQADVGGAPSGIPLAISQLRLCSTISGAAYYGFDFINPVQTINGSKYWTVLEANYPIAAAPWIAWICDGNGAYANNKFLSYYTSWEDLTGGSITAIDGLFKEYYGSGQHLILFDI